MMSFDYNERNKLGCKAYELEYGVEFSYDGGVTWFVVRTEPRYRTEESNELQIMCSPEEAAGLSAWHEVCIEDSAHVLLQRNWRSYDTSGDEGYIELE